jgi:hypothetical protein
MNKFSNHLAGWEMLAKIVLKYYSILDQNDYNKYMNTLFWLGLTLGSMAGFTAYMLYAMRNVSAGTKEAVANRLLASNQGKTSIATLFIFVGILLTIYH